MKMPWKCTGPKIFVRRYLMQEMLGLCEAENGTHIDEVLQAGASGHRRAWEMLHRFRFSRTAGGKTLDN